MGHKWELTRCIRPPPPALPSTAPPEVYPGFLCPSACAHMRRLCGSRGPGVAEDEQQRPAMSELTLFEMLFASDCGY